MYNLSVEKAGFTTERMDALKIEVGQRASIAIVLRIGEDRTSVTVLAPGEANARLIPATVALTARSALWAKALPNIEAHPEMVVTDGVDLAWVVRKNNPN
jgi:hypothetical protein